MSKFIQFISSFKNSENQQPLLHFAIITFKVQEICKLLA